MNKERIIMFVIIVGILFTFLSSISIGSFFGEIYLIYFVILLILGSNLFFLTLYLRIQHNVERLYKLNKEYIRFFDGLFSYLEKNKKDNEAFHNNLIDIFKKKN